MFRKVLNLLFGGALLAALLGILPADAAQVGIKWESMSIPASIAGKEYKLDALLLYPDDDARHPLAIVNHGSPRNSADRPTMLATANAEQMLWLARQGWTVAAVLRRGYGQSEGGWAETYGSCKKPDYLDAGLRGAADIAASIRFLASNPHVDGSRTIAVGVSAGAFATVALTTDPPAGLAAAVAFAPGRGSYASDEVCDQDRLIAAFEKYGETSRIPLLWISARNDHFFDPQLVKESVAAFNGAGGRATFFGAPDSGDEGHYFFSSTDGAAIWQPVVSEFLARNGLALAVQPLDLQGDKADPPQNLGPHGRAAFARYLLLPPHKAFALTADGYFTYFVGRHTTNEASAKAGVNCPKAAHDPCTVVNVDGAPVR
jgi:dienelactone hydrolase